MSLALDVDGRVSVTCRTCWEIGYYLLVHKEEWEWVRCDCFLDKEKEEGNE